MYSSFIELEGILKDLPINRRRIITLDEAQNEFDKRQFGTKSNIHKTYFLNFFRKFNTELYFNVVNLNRLEFRLEDMCSSIYFPIVVNSKTVKLYDVLTGNILLFNPTFFFNKYNTLEYIVPTFEKTTEYIIKKLTQDKTFKLLIREGSNLNVLRTFIQTKYHISGDMSRLIYDLYVVNLKT